MASKSSAPALSSSHLGDEAEHAGRKYEGSQHHTQHRSLQSSTNGTLLGLVDCSQLLLLLTSNYVTCDCSGHVTSVHAYKSSAHMLREAEGGNVLW